MKKWLCDPSLRLPSRPSWQLSDQSLEAAPATSDSSDNISEKVWERNLAFSWSIIAARYCKLTLESTFLQAVCFGLWWSWCLHLGQSIKLSRCRQFYRRDGLVAKPVFAMAAAGYQLLARLVQWLVHDFTAMQLQHIVSYFLSLLSEKQTTYECSWISWAPQSQLPCTNL